MNLRSDRVAQSGEVEVGVERGVDLGAAVHDTGLCSLNIAHEQPIAGTSHHLKQQNTIYLFTFQKEITS